MSAEPQHPLAQCRRRLVVANATCLVLGVLGIPWWLHHTNAGLRWMAVVSVFTVGVSSWGLWMLWRIGGRR